VNKLPIVKLIAFQVNRNLIFPVQNDDTDLIRNIKFFHHITYCKR